MTTFVGANLEQLAGLASTFTGEGAEVERLNRSIEATLGQTQWTGRVSEQFRRRWHEEFRPTLVSLSEALNEAARVVTARRDAIDQATNIFAG